MFREATATKARLSLPIAKVRPGQTVNAILQSRKPLFAEVHWFSRQIPCAGEGCPACVTTPTRVKGFAVVLIDTGKSYQEALLEFSPQAWSRVDGLIAMSGCEMGPGLVLECTRRRSNSPLRMEPSHNVDRIIPDLTSQYRVIAALSVIWSLSPPQAGETAAAWSERVRPACVERLKRAVQHSA